MIESTMRIEIGNKVWRLPDNTIHRIDGPAIEYANGTKSWYQNGQLHRLDGPAIEYANGDKVWYQNGLPHRFDGPAVECANGYKAWYLFGIQYTKTYYWALVNNPSLMALL